jgi:hypothetical protein
VTVPVAFSAFPGEIFQAPRSWVEKSYPNLVYFHEAARGGHFAAWEEPQLFSEELRAAFRSPALTGDGDKGRRVPSAAGARGAHMVKATNHHPAVGP